MSEKKRSIRDGSRLSAILLEKKLMRSVPLWSVPQVGFLNGLLAIVQAKRIGLRNNRGAHKLVLPVFPITLSKRLNGFVWAFTTRACFVAPRQFFGNWKIWVSSHCLLCEPSIAFSVGLLWRIAGLAAMNPKGKNTPFLRAHMPIASIKWILLAHVI